MSVYYMLPFLGVLRVPVMGQRGHLLNTGTSGSWCRGRAGSALPQPEGSDSRASRDTRESGALPAASTGAEMLPGSWSEPICPQFSSGLAGLVLLWTLGSGKDAQALLQESSAPLGLKQAFPFADGGDTDPRL